MIDLTPRQVTVMLAIQRCIALTGHSPTLESLGAECGITSKGRMHHHVAELIARGYLAKHGARARSLTVLKPLPDDRFEEAAKQVCSALGVVTPDNIAKAREAIQAALMPVAA